MGKRAVVTPVLPYVWRIRVRINLASGNLDWKLQSDGDVLQRLCAAGAAAVVTQHVHVRICPGYIGWVGVAGQRHARGH